MGTLEEGAKQAVENCVRLRTDENVVLIMDKGAASVADAIRAAAGRFTKKIRTFVMEDMGERPVAFPDSLREALLSADVSFYAAGGVEGELQSFRMPLLAVIDKAPNLRHAHMIGITEEIMRDGMCADYTEIQRVSGLVYERVRGARKISVRTEAGTDFTASISPALRWCISDGAIKGGEFSNLPDGEVFTCPESVDGRAVIDGCLGDFFLPKYGDLGDSPVAVDIREGRAVRGSFRCGNRDLEREFAKHVLDTDEHSARVGEFAIGTNVGLKKLIGNLLQDEKFPGVHIAFGDPYPSKTGAGWESRVHVDGVIRDTTILVDGEPLMENGEFRLSR